MIVQEEGGSCYYTPGAVVVSERREWLISRVEESVFIESFGMLVFEDAGVDEAISGVSRRDRKEIFEDELGWEAKCVLPLLDSTPTATLGCSLLTVSFLRRLFQFHQLWPDPFPPSGPVNPDFHHISESVPSSIDLSIPIVLAREAKDSLLDPRLAQPTLTSTEEAEHRPAFKFILLTAAPAHDVGIVQEELEIE